MRLLDLIIFSLQLNSKFEMDCTSNTSSEFETTTYILFAQRLIFFYGSRQPIYTFNQSQLYIFVKVTMDTVLVVGHGVGNGPIMFLNT